MLTFHALFFVSCVLCALRIEQWEYERAQNPTSSTEEADKVMEKLRISSLKWHHLGTIDPFRSRGFEAYLTPFQFKQQIMKSFEVSLTKSEVGLTPSSPLIFFVLSVQ